jgi:hypothetical protein
VFLAMAQPQIPFLPLLLFSPLHPAPSIRRLLRRPSLPFMLFCLY